MPDPPWVLWARSLPLARWNAWRDRADRIPVSDAHPGRALETALEAAWREMTAAPSPPPPASPRAVYAVLDLETGGTDPRTCAICSVAVMTLDDDMNEITRYHRLVADDPGKSYWTSAMKVNGLDSFRLRRSGTPINRVLLDLSVGLKGKVIVGHNIAFDLRFLAERGIVVGGSICTLELSKAAFPDGSHKLGAMAERLGVEQGPAHDALGDVITTANVFRALAKLVPAREAS